MRPCTEPASDIGTSPPRRSMRARQPSTFPAERLTRLAEIERDHFWFRARRRLVEERMNRSFPSVGARIVDFGCGTAFSLEPWTERGYRMVGADLRFEGLQARRRTLGHALLLQAKSPELPFGRGVFDGALLLDVLEHVDDLALLREMHRVLRRGGRLLLTVPALPWLWSFRDESAGHLRRYTRMSLREVLTCGGFAVESIDYNQCLLLPLLAVTRLLGRRGARLRDREDCPPGPLNAAFAGITQLEGTMGRWIRWPLGSSLIAVCTRMEIDERL